MQLIDQGSEFMRFAMKVGQSHQYFGLERLSQMWILFGTSCNYQKQRSPGMRRLHAWIFEIDWFKIVISKEITRVECPSS